MRILNLENTVLNATSFLKRDLNKDEKIKKGTSQENLENSNKDENTKEETKEIKQTDFSKCWTCEKKVGIRGFTCKCQYYFCKKHRLPENH